MAGYYVDHQIPCTTEDVINVQNMIDEMQAQFRAISDDLDSKIDDLAMKIDAVEQSIDDLEPEIESEESVESEASSPATETSVESEEPQDDFLCEDVSQPISDDHM